MGLRFLVSTLLLILDATALAQNLNETSSARSSNPSSALSLKTCEGVREALQTQVQDQAQQKYLFHKKYANKPILEQALVKFLKLNLQQRLAFLSQDLGITLLKYVPGDGTQPPEYKALPEYKNLPEATGKYLEPFTKAKGLIPILYLNNDEEGTFHPKNVVITIRADSTANTLLAPLAMHLFYLSRRCEAGYIHDQTLIERAETLEGSLAAVSKVIATRAGLDNLETHIREALKALRAQGEFIFRVFLDPRAAYTLVSDMDAAKLITLTNAEDEVNDAYRGRWERAAQAVLKQHLNDLELLQMAAHRFLANYPLQDLIEAEIQKVP